MYEMEARTQGRGPVAAFVRQACGSLSLSVLQPMWGQLSGSHRPLVHKLMADGGRGSFSSVV